jgi:hypothetical protein
MLRINYCGALSDATTDMSKADLITRLRVTLGLVNPVQDSTDRRFRLITEMELKNPASEVESSVALEARPSALKTVYPAVL